MAAYFTKETDEYIKKFLKAEGDEKHRLFNEGIRPAFQKLIESLIYVYKFYTTLDDVETLKKDCLANLYEMLPKYDPNKGTKGFSYFNVVAKNWFIQKTREQAKKNRIEKEFHVDIDREIIRNNPNLTVPNHEDAVIEKEFWQSLFTELEEWRTQLVKKNELKILEAIIFLMNNSHLFPIYNKKAVYMYLREMTGFNEKQVAMGLKKMRSMYAGWKDKYLEDGQ